MSEKEIQKKIVEQWRDEHSERNYFCYISNTIHIATRINDF